MRVRYLCVLLVFLGALAPAAPRAWGQVRLNELQASNRSTLLDDEQDSSDWIEIFNEGAFPVDLGGWSLSDDPRDLAKWTFPNVELAQGKRLIVWCSGKDRSVPADAAIEAEDSTLPFDPSLVDAEAKWQYTIGPPEETSPPEGWNRLGFAGENGSPWPSGTGPFGFGEDGIRTEFPPEIGTVFLRHEFRVADPPRLLNLVLDAVYDDGFVVWLNGIRILNVGYTGEADPNFASRAQTGVEMRHGRWNISEHLDLLGTENVIAIALLNLRASSADLYLALSLGTVPPVLHSSFRLDEAGETIALSAPDGSIADVVTFPEQEIDRSYGRYPDGSGELSYMLFPTPGTPNDQHISAEPIPNEVHADPPPGYYSAPVLVTLETRIPFANFETRYTLDGAEPSTSSLLYDEPIPISRDASLRARGFLDGQPVTHTTSYSYYGISTTTRNLTLPVLSISMSPEDYQFVHNSADARGRATAERQGFLEIFEASGNRVASAGMGLRLHGGAGRGGDFNTKKAYRLYFRDEYGAKKLHYRILPDTDVDSFDKLVLRSNFNDAFRTGNEAAFIRDQVIRDLHEQMGADVSHGAWYNLIVNGRYRGLYNVVERLDKNYFASYYPEDGEAWYVVKTGNDILDGGADASQAWTALRRFFTTNDLRQGSTYDEAGDLIDIENFTSYMILNIWAQNHDWPHNNWYAARPAREDGRWVFLSWDAEFGIGRVPGGYTSDTFAHVFSRGDSAFTLIFQSLLRNPIYQDYFLEQLALQLENALSPENVIATIDREATLIAADVAEEAALTGRSEGTWRNNVEAMRTFARGRNPVIENFILRSNRFTFPRALSISPRVIEPEGEVEVKLTGIRFTENTTVSFSGVSSPRVRYIDSRELAVAVPFDIRLAGAPKVTVEDPVNGRSTTPDLFEVRFIHPEPESIEPAFAPPGSTILVHGRNFTEGVRVEFGGVASPLVRRLGGGRETIAVVVPEGSIFGRVDVVVINTRPGDLPASVALPFEIEDPLRFRRGDADGNGVINVADPVRTLRWLTTGVSGPICQDAMDADDSGRIDITDPIFVLGWLFRGSAEPAAPFASCGSDPTGDTLGCSLATSACP